MQCGCLVKDKRRGRKPNPRSMAKDMVNVLKYTTLCPKVRVSHLCSPRSSRNTTERTSNETGNHNYYKENTAYNETVNHNQNEKDEGAKKAKENSVKGYQC